MTTTMTKALQEAGITVPQNKRIWLWLKDHPGKPTGDIAGALKIHIAGANAALRDMEARGMVTSLTTMRRVRSGGRNAAGRMIERNVLAWEVNPKMQEFELWPRPAKPKAKKAVDTPPVQAALVKAPEPAKEAVAPPTWTPEGAVEKLTLTQCRELFNYLHKVFKE